MPFPKYPAGFQASVFLDPGPQPKNMKVPDVIDLNASRSRVEGDIGSESDTQYLSLLQLGLTVLPVLTAPPKSKALPPIPSLSKAPAKRIMSTSTFRNLFAPVHEKLVLGWKLKNPGMARSLTIEIFRQGEANAIRTVTLTWNGKAASEHGSVALTGILDKKPRVKGGGNPAVTLRSNYTTATFPHHCLTVEHSPYKMKVSVAPKNGTDRFDVLSRWIYVDVLMANITLEFGAPADIPAARSDVRAAVWTKAREDEILAGLKGALIPHALPSVAHHDVPLNSNRFCAGVESAGTLGIEEHGARWGDGPRIPLIATIGILKSDRSTVVVRKALGNSQFVWDWDDPRDQALNRAWENWIDFHTTQRSRDYLDETVKKRTQGGILASYNCPVGFGGKFLGNGPVFLPVHTDPFAQTALAQRPGAVLTKPGLGARAGKTGVLLQPSRMAGDQYRVRVYWYKATSFPVPLKAVQVAASAGVKGWPWGETGTFEVLRKVRLEYLHTQVIAPPTVPIAATYLRECGTILDVTATAFRAQYDIRVTAAIQQFMVNPLANEDVHSLRFMVNGASGYGVPLRTHAEFRAEILNACVNNNVYKVPVPGPISAEWHKTGVPADRFHVLVSRDEGGQCYAYLLAEAAGTTLADQDILDYYRNAAQHVNVNGAPQLVPALDRQRIFNEASAATTWTLLGNAQSYQGQVVANNWPKQIMIECFKSIAANDFAAVPEALFCLDFEGITPIDPVGGSALTGASTALQGFVYAASPDANANRRLFKDATTVMTHEIGHAFFINHAANNLREDSGYMDDAAEDPYSARRSPPLSPEQHLPHDSCLMNYDHDTECFCGVCMLHMRGWNYKVARDDSEDLEKALGQILADINSGRWLNTTWLTLRSASLLSFCNRRRKRNAVKDRVKALITPLAPPAGGGSDRIALLRSLILIYVETQEKCNSIPGFTVHQLRRELTQLIGAFPLEAVDSDLAMLLNNREDDHFCIHTAVPQIVFTNTAPSNGRRQIRLLATGDFDGKGTLGANKALVEFYATDVAVAPIPIRELTCAELAEANPLRLWVSDPTVNPFADLTLTLALSGGSVTLKPATSTATALSAVVRAKAKVEMPGGRYIFVRADTTKQKAPRAKIHLSVDRAFDGSGVLNCSNPEVRFYLANEGGDPLNIANKPWPSLALLAGVDVWAESEQPSHAKKDITLTLRLAPALVARYTAVTVDGSLTVTAVRAVLDICYDPVMVGASPTRLAPTVKYDPGRILQPPAAGNQSRACLIVRRVVPADVKAKLTLTVKNDKVRLFKLQTPVAHETPRVLPLSVGVPGKGGTVYWVEGVNGSAAPGDAGFELTVKIDGVNYVNVDQAAVTVATVKTTAKIPVTPAKSDRGAEGFSKVPPKYREFTATADHGGNFDANAPLVLLENSVPVNDPVQLTIEVFPAGGTVANLAMIRATDDHLTLAGLALPTIALVNNTGQLRSDSRGSFHVTADVTINGALQNGLVCLNVVIAGVDLVAESCTTPNPDAGLAVFQTGGCVFAYFQNPLGLRYPDSKMDSPHHPFVVEFASIHMRATATIVGGGPDGKRGVNKILGGWINNLTGLDIRAGYRDLAAANPPQDGRVQFVINRAQANRQPPFVPDEPGFDGLRAPVEAAYSPTAGLLDTGGNQAILSASRYLYRHPDEEAPRIRSNGAFNADTPAAGQPPVLGREVLIDSMDSPATNFDFQHPLNAALYLTRFREWYGFSAYLSFWADGDAVNERLYGVMCRVDWVVDADWTVTWNANPPGNPTHINETHFVLASAAAVAVPRAGRPPAVMIPTVTTIIGRANFPLASAAATDVEVAGPLTHNLKARDYRIL